MKGEYTQNVLARARRLAQLEQGGAALLAQRPGHAGRAWLAALTAAWALLYPAASAALSLAA